MEYKKAMAFIEAMCGWEDIAEGQSKPLSPHCITHLKAVFGNDAVFNLGFWSNKPTGNIKGLENIADYLIEVGTTIKEEIQAKSV